MASIRTRTLPSGKPRYDVIWRCVGCEKHPGGGKQHVKTFIRRKDAETFEVERTRDEIAGEIERTPGPGLTHIHLRIDDDDAERLAMAFARALTAELRTLAAQRPGA